MPRQRPSVQASAGPHRFPAVLVTLALFLFAIGTVAACSLAGILLGAGLSLATHD